LIPSLTLFAFSKLSGGQNIFCSLTKHDKVPTYQKNANAGSRGHFRPRDCYWISENIIAHLGDSNFLITVLWGVGGIKALACLEGT